MTGQSNKMKPINYNSIQYIQIKKILYDKLTYTMKTKLTEIMREKGLLSPNLASIMKVFFISFQTYKFVVFNVCNRQYYLLKPNSDI